MSLIMLDTPQLHLLERVRRIDPIRYSSFRDTWKRRGCTVVFTRAQASELGRYGNTVRRQARYQVLADLAPIRTDLPVSEATSLGPHTFIEREIVRAMVERGVVKPANPDADPLPEWIEMLPGHLNASEWIALALIEVESYRDLLKREYDAHRFAAGAEKHHGQTKRGRVCDLPSEPLPAEKVLAGRAEIERAFISMQEQSQRGELPQMPPDALNVILESALPFLARMGEIGNQDAFLERLPVTRFTKAELLKMNTDEVINNSVFEACLRNFAREVLNANETDQDFLARTLAFADCPGSWLQRRLELCVRHASREPKPNHHFDAERLSYLPYVDMLLTDKEMANFVRQIRRDEFTPTRILNAPPAVSIPNSIDVLEEKIDSLCAPSNAATASA